MESIITNAIINTNSFFKNIHLLSDCHEKNRNCCQGANGYCKKTNQWIRPESSPGRMLENSCSDRTRDCEFSDFLSQLFLQDLLLFLTETKPENAKLIQRPLREINLTKLKTNLLFDFIYLLRGEL